MSNIMTVTETTFEDQKLIDAWKNISSSLSHGSPNFFQSIEWNKSWWEYFGEPNSKYHLSLLIIRDDAGQEIGIAPLFQAVRTVAGLEAWRSVHWIGHKLTPYPDIISLEGKGAEIWRAVMEYFRAHHSSAWFELGGILEGHSLQLATLEKVRIERKPDERYLSVDIDKRKGSDEWCRKHLDRSLRKWNDKDYNWSFVTGNDAVVEERLRELNMKRFGNASFFFDPASRDFYTVLLSQNPDACWHAIIRYKDSIVSIYSGFTSGNTLHYFLSGTERDFEVGSMRLGALNLYFLFKNMLSMGYTHFDFLRGEEEYKMAYEPEVELSEEWIITPASSRKRQTMARILRRFRRAI